MNKVMFNKDFLNEVLPFINKITAYKSHKGYVTSKKDELRFINADKYYFDSVCNIITHTHSFDTGLILKVSSDFNAEDSINHFQGMEIYFPELEGFVTKKPLQMIITTDNELSTIQIFSLAIDFIVDYKKDIKNYSKELNMQLEGLCHGILLEEDENLTDESIEIKRKLTLIFEPIELV